MHYSTNSPLVLMSKIRLTSGSPAIIRVDCFGGCGEARANADVRILVRPDMRGLEGNTKLLAHIHIDPSATTISDTRDGAAESVLEASTRRMVAGGSSLLAEVRWMERLVLPPTANAVELARVHRLFNPVRKASHLWKSFIEQSERPSSIGATWNVLCVLLRPHWSSD